MKMVEILHADVCQVTTDSVTRADRRYAANNGADLILSCMDRAEPVLVTCKWLLAAMHSTAWMTYSDAINDHTRCFRYKSIL